jgi:VWFA-related protein
MRTRRAARRGSGDRACESAVVLTAVLLSTSLAAQAPQRPTFRAGTDLVLVDAQVVTRSGEPVTGLGPDDFEVEFGGSRRRVVSAEYIRYGSTATLVSDRVDGSAPVTTAPAAEVAATPRRLYILTVDESSFSPLAAMAWREAIKRFIERLQPGDLAGLYAYPLGGPLVPLTLDHQAVLAGADRVAGRLEPPLVRYHMSLAEMVDITRGDLEVTRRVAERECTERWDLKWCIDRGVPAEALAYATHIEMATTQSIGGLRTLMRSLRDLPERKTVVVISGGLFATDQIGGRGDVSDLISAVGQEAARANANLYTLHLDTKFIEMFSPRARALPSMFRDLNMWAMGLERFAGIAGGELIRVQAGTGDYAFERVLLETSAYYLLGVEPAPSDRNGRVHHVTVKVARRDAVVRSRAWVVVPAAGG